MVVSYCCVFLGVVVLVCVGCLGGVVWVLLDVLV